jgi:hypothetical protein
MQAMKAKIEALKESYVRAKSQEHDAVSDELLALCDENAVAVADATLESIRETNAEPLREKLNDVLPIMSVSYLAKTCFHRSPRWFPQRPNGNSVNGKQARFTSDELKALHSALLDISGRIGASAASVF